MLPAPIRKLLTPVRTSPSNPVGCRTAKNGQGKPCPFFGRGDGICAFGGAPRRTAHRAVRFALALPASGSDSQTAHSRSHLHPQIPSVAVQQKTGRKNPVRFLVEATGFEPTTSWSRTASRQDKSGAHFPFGKHAAPIVCRSFPPKSAAHFLGSPK